MAKVFSRHANYHYETLKPQIFEMMEAMGGSAIQSRDRVLIKPNLLAPAASERAMLTHPLIVRAVVEYVNEHGVIPQLSDSPAMGTFDRVLRESGIKNALQGLDVECKEFKTSVSVDCGEPFKKLEIAEAALRADVLINLPKLKTHSQMLLTLGVKNLFGCIVGFRKPEWHFRTGVDRDMFALLLVKIHQVLKPSITILDGILGMEGQGPGRSGRPRTLGVLMGSSDAIALDTAVCRMLGIDPARVPTNKAAEALGLSTSEIEIDGELPRIYGFKLPEITPLVFGPKCSQSLLRKHLIQRPVPDSTLCKSCGECWNYCPAGAITHAGKKVIFDYDKCIRCYCCIEVCPHAALRTEEPWMGKLLAKFTRRSES